MTESENNPETTQIDLRGLLCPEPVIRTKRIFDKAETTAVEAIVDDDVCVSNLQRLAKSMRAICKVQELDGYFSVHIERSSAAQNALESTTATTAKDASVSDSKVANSSKMGHRSIGELASAALVAQREVPDNKRVGTVVFLTKDQLGEGDPDFGRSLLNIFLQTLLESGHRPRAILMANSAVKIMRKDSPVLKVLQDFQDAGSDVFACGLCVDFYGLKQDIAKEQITNMFAICEYLTAAEKVITP